MKFHFPIFLALTLATFLGCGRVELEPGVLYINVAAEVQDLDPHLTTGVPEHRVLAALFEGLTDVDMATGDPIPGVAESWTVSEDGLVYTFNLRRDAAWSNGDPVTAHDFHYAWRRMLSPALAAEYAYMLHIIRNAEQFNNGELSDFEEVGVRVLDDFTLEVTLEHPAPYFLTMHNHQSFYPVHQATIEQFGRMDQRDTPWTRTGNHVGNGPFLLTAWRPNEVLTVRPNPHYWDSGNLRLTGINFYPIQDQQTEERAFRAGELQWTSEVPLHRVEVYQRDNPHLITIHPYMGIYYYRVNVTRPVLNDLRVRQALSMTLDREELTRNVLKAGEQPARHFVPPGIEGYESKHLVEYNPERARELLAEAGFPNGQGFPRFEILYNTAESHRVIAETVQRMWRETLNIDVGLINQDWKVYLDNMNALNYDLARSGWIWDFEDPVNGLETMLSDGGNNRTGWGSEDFDRLVFDANRTVDPAARFEMLGEAERLLLEDLPVIPIYFYTRKFLKAPEVLGYAPNDLGYIRWMDIHFADTPAEN